jgi:hypothetical protein
VVFITQEAKDSGKTYTLEDFPELDLTDVKHRIYTFLDVEHNYLYVYLKHPSDKNARAAVRILKKRADVETARRLSLS